MAGMRPDQFDDPRISLATLAAQVNSVVADQHDLKLVVLGIEKKFEAAFVSINTKLDAKSQPQWQAYGVMLTAVLAIGALAYWPVRESTAELKNAMVVQSASIRELYISRSDDLRRENERLNRLLEKRQID